MRKDRERQGLSLHPFITIPGFIFVLGFFSPPDSDDRYLGIWYNTPGSDDRKSSTLRRGGNFPRTYVTGPHPKQPVWVGNINSPVQDKTGALVIASDGNLRVVNGGGDRIADVSNAVVSHSHSRSDSSSSAVLLDSGNLELRAANGTVVWQSFEYPTDTLLPGMKLGANLRTGHVWSLKPWLGGSLTPWLGSPTRNFSFGLLDPKGRSNEMVIMWEGRVYWRSGNWGADKIFRGLNFSYTSNNNNNGEERYMSYSVKGGDKGGNFEFPRITITSGGTLIGQYDLYSNFQTGSGSDGSVIVY